MSNHCYVCGIKITLKNSANAKAIASSCRSCHAEVAYCKQWRKKPIKEIIIESFRLKRKAWLLGQIAERKKTGIRKGACWRHEGATKKERTSKIGE